MSSAVKMLKQKDYKEITVLDLVADSGVNRNTFYYHFKDMDALIVELSKTVIEHAFSTSRLGLSDKLIDIVNLLYKNRDGALHVYNSADRVDFDKGLFEVCEYIAAKICSVNAELKNKSELEKDAWRSYVKCSCYGLASDWLAKGLNEDGYLNLRTIIEKTN